MESKSIAPDTRLTREALAQALTSHGLPIAANTLRTKATRGGGPPYRKFGRVALYQWGDALAWAEGRLSPALGSTSQEDAARRPAA